MSEIKKIYILSGGTGGHVYPAKVMAEKFLSEGVEVIWIGTSRGPEKKIAENLKIKFIKIPLSGFRGKSFLSKFKALIAFFLTGIYFLIKIWPFKIFVKNKIPLLAFGGYVSLAAFFYFKGPVYLQEQNTIPGSVSRLLVSTKKVKKVFCGFKQTQKYFNKISNEEDKIILSGNPLNLNIYNLYEDNKKNFLKDNFFKLLVLGGSQGSRSLNSAMPKALSKIENLWIKHQCGRGNFEETQTIYKENSIQKNRVEIIEYLENIHEYYGWADIIICRSGALTVSEIACSGSLGIFIPLPWAVDNHQFFNAKSLKDVNAGFLVEETKNLEEDLILVLENIKKTEVTKLELMKENSYRSSLKHPEKIIYEEIKRT